MREENGTGECRKEEELSLDHGAVTFKSSWWEFQLRNAGFEGNGRSQLMLVYLHCVGNV